MKRVCICMLAAVLMVTLFSSCKTDTAQAAEQGDAMSIASEQYSTLDQAKLKDSVVAGMKLVAENDRYQLCLNFATTDFALVDKDTNQILYSNPLLEDPAISVHDDVKGNWISNLVISYNDKIKNEYTYCTYTDSVSYGQFEVLSLKDGVRIVYKMGKDETKALIPPVLSVESYNSIWSQLASRQQKVFKACYNFLLSKDMTNGESVDYIDKNSYLKKYPALETTDLYVLRDLTAYQKKQLQEIMQGVGFTYQDMQEQIEQAGYTATDESVCFTVPLDITIDEDGFNASVNADLIDVPSGYSLYKISILCGLGAGTKEGDFLVPDGSGALISMVDESGSVYSQSIYGSDDSRIDKTAVLNDAQVILPVYASATEQGSLLSAITSGEAVATITVKQKGKNNPMAAAYTSFIYTDKDNKNADESTTIESLITARNHTKGNFSLHYIFNNKKSSYAQLAVTYRSYLESNGLLSRKQSNEYSFVMDIYGSMNKKGYVFGIPATVQQKLTTFDQAQDILAYFVNAGIQSMSVRYIGMANNGLQNSAANKFNVLSCLGGNSGYKKLLKYAKQNTITIYPDLDLNYVYKDSLFDGFSASADVSKRMDFKNATVTELGLVNGEETKNLFHYVVSSSSLFKNAKSLLKDLTKQGQQSISLSSTGEKLNSNFSKEAYASRADAQNYTEDALKLFHDQNISLMVSTGNLYSLAYAQTVVNLPNGHSGLTMEKACVPFVQIVLNGYVNYAAKAFNQSNSINKAQLNAIETDALVYYSFMAEDNMVLKNSDFENLNSICFSTWAERAYQSYQTVAEALEPVKNAQIVDHLNLTEMVSKTVYDNGICIYVNYSDTNYIADNLTIPAGGYAIGGTANT